MPKDPRIKKVLVIGSGPIIIGQAAEFDYAGTQACLALREEGYEVVLANSNPATIMTDTTIADKVYMEPLTLEYLARICRYERPDAIVPGIGGQTGLNLAMQLAKKGVLKECEIELLGTDAESIERAEDRELFKELCESIGEPIVPSQITYSIEEGLEAAEKIGYPVILRPAFTLGGTGGGFAYDPDEMRDMMKNALALSPVHQVLVEKSIKGYKEIEYEVIRDANDTAITVCNMENLDPVGIHTGDSIVVAPSQTLTNKEYQMLRDSALKIIRALGVKGGCNVQFALDPHSFRYYVIEVNPRSSRTVPYISKVTGIPIVDLATEVIIGKTIRELGYEPGLQPEAEYFAIKMPVFSFEKLTDVDIAMGPEMKSTGEVLGIGTNLQEAIFKGLVAAGYKMRHQGGILVSVRDKDKPEAIDCARKFAKLGFNIFATPGTARAMQEHGLYAAVVKKEAQEKMLEMGQVQYVISTSSKGRLPQLESVRMRRKAVERGIPLFTSLDTANALANALTSRYSLGNVELVDINNMRTKHKKLTFTKMRGTGNDYLYFDCFDQTVESPESLAVRLSNRRTGVGSDGIVLIMPSTIADAKMRMFNADGTEGSVAGNALRCVCKYLYENGHVRKDEMAVETGSGVKTAKLFIREDQVFSVLVDMGCPAFAPAKIPVKLDGDRVMMRPVFLAGEKREISCVSMGNPHVVIFVEDVNRIPLEQVGPQIETDSLFPERVNVSFAQIVDKNDIVMRVWERGIGETAACGTGACAVAVAAVENGFCTRGADIDVRLPGGTLVVRYQEDGKVWLTGDANTDFTGTIEI